MGTVQLAAVLFCDLVDSTALLVRDGDERFDALRRRLDDIVTRAVADCRGRVVKGLGDGALAAFDAPSDALRAATAVQQATRNAGGLAVRIGISAGEVSTDDGDVFGTTVVEAARLCAAAAEHQILVSATAALLARHGSIELRSVRALDLKGFPEPVEAFEVLWTDVPDRGRTDGTLPAALRIQPSFPFVARSREWSTLVDTWDVVQGSGRALVVVRGEPGAGKTRLVAEFARHVATRGAPVLFGACHADGGPPYEAFAEALVDSTHVFLAAGSEPGAAPTGDRRDALFAAVGDCIAEMGGRSPVLLVLDDMHWARRPTVQLLLHLLRTPAPLRLCIVVTHRDARDDIGDAFDSVLADLHRIEGITHVNVGGLDKDGVAEFVRAASGSRLDPTLTNVAELLSEQTDGNPFLLGELWRHLVETGALTRDHGGYWRSDPAAANPVSPDAVRAVVGRRIDQLPAAAREFVDVAAIVGSPFAVDVVADVVGTDRAGTLQTLELALANGTIEEIGAGTFAFSHELVRRAIYDRLSVARRTQLHLDVARTIEQQAPSDRLLGALAYHYIAAVPLADPDAAVAVTLRAADVAMRSLAYEDASALLERALPLTADPIARAELLLELAEANLSAGDTARVLEQTGEVVDIARAESRLDLLTGAALACEEALWRLGLPGAAAERLLREVLPHTTDEKRRIRVLASRGRALALSGEPGADAVIEEAIAAARAHGDPEVLHFALGSWFNLPWRPERYPRMLERAYELRELAASASHLSTWALVNAQQWLIVSLLLTGRFTEALEASAEHSRLAERTRQPFHRHLAAAGESTFALMAGRFDDAEACAERANKWSEMMSGADTSGAYGVQMFSLRREQGRLAEVKPVVEAIVRLERAHAAWRPGLAAVYAELGMLDEARAEVAYLVDATLRHVPRDALYVGSLTYLADAVVAIGDRGAAATLYAALEPYRGTVAVVGHLIACYGAVDRYLGSLAETAGRARDAERHYASAIEIDARSGSPVWLAHSRYRYARFLARQNRRDGTRRAADLLAGALEAIRRVGMPALEAKAETLANELDVDRQGDDIRPTATGPTVDLTRREREILACLTDGLSNAEIGRALHVSPNTAANHVRSILMKTGCANRTEAAAWAVRNGVLPG